MSEATDTLILRCLRRLDDKIGGLRDDMRKMKTRVGLLEQPFARLSNRIDRIEKRLGLVAV